MTTESRRQKSAEKSRKRRSEAQRAREVRVRREGVALEGVIGQPGPAWASSSWTDQGAKVKAVFSRFDAKGRLAVAAITADLSTGALEAELARWAEAGFEGRVSAFGAPDQMVEVAPALVARIALEAVAFGAQNGREIPAIWPQLQKLFGDVDAADSPFAPSVGPPAPRKAKGPGILDTLRKWLRRPTDSGSP